MSREMFPYPGLLVTTHDGYYGIILESTLDRGWLIMTSNGISVWYARKLFTILPMKAGEDSRESTACFIELVTAYNERRPK